MQFYLKFLLVFLCVSMLTTVRGQISFTYNMGVIGNTGEISPAYSGPFAITGEQCFVFSNGVKIMLEKQIGFFSNSCLEKQPQISLLAVYPNPVISQLTVKANESLAEFTGIVTMVLSDMSGKELARYATSRASLLSGFQIKLPLMAAGMHVLRVNMGNTGMQTLGFIKTNP